MTSASPAQHGGLGEPSRLVGVEALVLVARDPHDRAPLGLEPRQVHRLVQVPLGEDEVAVRVGEDRLLELAARDGDLQRRQVRARKMTREVGWRQREAAVAELHTWSISTPRPVCLRARSKLVLAGA